MKKIGFMILMMLLSQAAFADDFLEKKEVKLGQPVGDFTLQDLDGRTISLSSLKGKPVMLHFWSAQCPFVVRYEERLKAIAADYGSKGAVIYGIDSNVTESVEQIKQAVAQRGVNYPILVDPGHKVADQFGAITTPHVYLIDKEGKLAYEGAVDNQGWSEKKKPTKHYVRDGLDALLTGKKVSKSKSKTVGCTVKRSAPHASF